MVLGSRHPARVGDDEGEHGEEDDVVPVLIGSLVVEGPKYCCLRVWF